MVYPIALFSHQAYSRGTAKPLSMRISMVTRGHAARRRLTMRRRINTTKRDSSHLPGRSAAVMSWSV